MLSSIHPLGERGRHNRFWLTASAFVVGATVGGLATGALAGALGVAVGALVPTEAALGVAVLAAAFGAVAELRGIPLPSVLRRQVDEDWLGAYRGWVYGAGFGFQLGAGVLTFMTSAAVHVALVAAVLVGDPLAAMATVGTFGLLRGLSILPARAIQTPDSLVSFHRTLQATAPRIRVAAASALAVAALAGGSGLL